MNIPRKNPDHLNVHLRKSIGAGPKGGTYALPVPTGAAGRMEKDMSGTYDGAELRPFTGIAGAMRAYSLPSKGAV